MSVDLLRASARRIPLADKSVQCIVTSPPYWGLRKYSGEQDDVWGGRDSCKHKWLNYSDKIGAGGTSEKQISNRGQTGKGYIRECGECGECGAWRGAYGLEPTIEMYIAHTVEILRECRRVLRSDGVLFWNVGDSYSSQTGQRIYRADGKHHAKDFRPGSGRADGIVDKRAQRNRDGVYAPGLKPKDLCLIPERVALAAQADGWWVRSLIIWSKPNPMPESVTDRPTDSYEHIIMLTKSARYFWDADAVRECAAEPDRARNDQFGGNKGNEVNHSPGAFSNGHSTRNMRNVWNFPTQPYAGAHFAAFPEELPRRCILAATSDRGCCTQCGKPWERVTRNLFTSHAAKTTSLYKKGSNGNRISLIRQAARASGFEYGTIPIFKQIGFRPMCRCLGQRGRTVPCVVLDPFGGSGTTGQVAKSLGRTAVLLDIGYTPGAYLELARTRIESPTREEKKNVKVPRKQRYESNDGQGKILFTDAVV